MANGNGNGNIIPEQAPGAGIDLSTSDIANFTPIGTREASFAPASQQEQDIFTTQVPGAPTFSKDTLFPGINDPINKGTVSSKTLGSQPVFVGSGGFLPFNILAEREKAMQQATANRKKRLLGTETKVERPLATNPRFQKNIDDKFFGTMDSFRKEAIATFGPQNADQALKSGQTDLGRRFQRELANLDILKRNTNEITDLASAVNVDQQTGDRIFSNNTLALAEDLNQAVGDFEGGQIADIPGAVQQLKGSMDVDQFINDNFLKGVVPSLQTFINDNIDKPNFNEIITTEVKSIKAQAKGFAQRAKSEGGRYSNVDFVSEKMIEDAINQRIGEQVSRKAQTVKKPSGSIGATEKDIDNRVLNINILKEPFGPNGELQNPTDESQKLLGRTIGAKLSGDPIQKARFEKGVPDPELDQTVTRIQRAFGVTGEDDLTDTAKELQKDLIGKKFNGVPIAKVEFGEPEFEGDVNKVTITTDKGKQTFDLTKPELFSELQSGLQDNFESSSDRVVFTVEEGTKGGESKVVERDFNADSQAYFDVMNAILNTSPGEKLKIKNEENADAIKKQGEDAFKPKDIRDVSFTQERLQALAEANGKSVDQIIQEANAKGINIIVQ